MHKDRLLTAVVFTPIFIFMVLKAHFFWFCLFIILINCVGLYETYDILHKAKVENFKVFGISVCAVLSLLFAYDVPSPSILFVLFLSFSAFLYALFFQENLCVAIQQVCGTVFGGVYVALFMSHFLLIWKLPEGRSLVLVLIAIVWLGDSGAYYMGSKFGKTKIAPSISPNKSLEGSVGGFIGSLLAAVLFKYMLIPNNYSLSRLLPVALLVAVVGQLGDLFESLLKRGASVKDSGVIVPGHGGLLDRLDSFVFSAPIFYYFMR